MSPFPFWNQYAGVILFLSGSAYVGLVGCFASRSVFVYIHTLATSAAGTPPSMAKGLQKSSLGAGCSWFSIVFLRVFPALPDSVTRSLAFIDIELLRNMSAVLKPHVPLERDG